MNWRPAVKRIFLVGAIVALSGSAMAESASLDRTCTAAKVAVEHYTAGNIMELEVHMTAVFLDMGNSMQSVNDPRLAWEDMLAILAQSDSPVGREAIQTFLDDNCD
jgi:hypothetical protein